MTRPVRRPTAEEHLAGQVARGEVRAGPAAAREIAARHERAYGAVFRVRRTPTQKDPPMTDLSSEPNQL